MARVFAITAADTTIPLSTNRNGEVTFTVTNTSKRSLRGRAKVVVKDATNESWLTIADEVERDFAPDATHQFTVRIQVAPGAPIGAYRFSLMASSIDNPDEEFAEGPVVAFEVQQAGPPPAKFPWWVIVVVVAVLVVGGVVVLLLTRKSSVAIPPVANLTEAQAKQKIEELCEKPTPCLKVTVVRQVDEQVEEGKAIATDPVEGSKVDPDSEITLFVSEGGGKVILKNVAGMKEALAKQFLESLCDPRPCVNVQVVHEASDQFDDGQTIRIDPPAETAVKRGSPVKLVVSKVVASGSLALLPSYTADLDDGTVKVSTSQADIYFDVNGGLLRPGFARAGFVRMGASPAHPKGCMDASSSLGSIPLDDVVPGNYICVRTTENRIAELRILAASKLELRFEFKTWNRPFKVLPIPIKLGPLKIER